MIVVGIILVQFMRPRPSWLPAFNSVSAHLSLTEVHLRVLGHELFEYVLLVLLVTGGLALPLHLLVVHHLLDHAARLAVELGQFRVLGHDLRRVDLGRRRHYVCPPVRPAGLGQVNRDLFGVVGFRG